MNPSPRSPAGALARWIALGLILAAIPIVPFALMSLSDRDPFELWARSVAERRATAAAVCFLLLSVDVLLPIPSSLVGLVSGQALGALLGGSINWAGGTLGHLIGFGAARRWGRRPAERLVGARALEEAGRAWERGATAGLILSRPAPVLAEAVAMFAGLTSLAPARFAAIVALANLPHSFIYGWAGARFGLNPSPAALGWAVGAGAAVPAAAYLLYALWRRRPGLQSADAVDYRGR